VCGKFKSQQTQIANKRKLKSKKFFFKNEKSHCVVASVDIQKTKYNKVQQTPALAGSFTPRMASTVA
jgi:hypothetical protein